MTSRGWKLSVLLGLAAALAVVAVPGARDLVRQLGAASAAERDAAADALRALGPGATPALEAAARDGGPAVRRRARALLELAREGVGHDSATAASAARALVGAALRDPRGLAPGSEHERALREMGTDGGRALASAARRAAGRSLLPAHLAVALARHPQHETTQALVDLLAERRLAPSSALLAARELELHDELPVSPDGLLDSLTSTARQRTGPARRAAVGMLGALGREDAVPALLAYSRDPYAGVRRESARALGRIAPARGARALRRLARDRDDDVRREALDALAHVPGRPRPESALVNADHADPRVRAAAARLLARDATPAALPTLDRLAQDDALSVRAAARRSRGQLGLAD